MLFGQRQDFPALGFAGHVAFQEQARIGYSRQPERGAAHQRLPLEGRGNIGNFRFNGLTHGLVTRHAIHAQARILKCYIA